MEIALAVIGVIVLVSGIAVGIQSGSFPGFLTSLLNSAAGAAVLFALAKVLGNQDELSERLAKLEHTVKNPPETITCAKCGTSYQSDDFSYCPHCGAKQEEKTK